MIGIILYGPPCSGKDTVSHTLESLDARYSIFPRLKVGPGRTTSYRMTTEPELDRLRAGDEILWENQRYSARYAVDRSTLLEQLDQGHPILHLGQVEAVETIIGTVPSTQWLVVYLWCPRDVAEERMLRRATGDVAERLQVWDETPPLRSADLTVDTSLTTPLETASLIAEFVSRESRRR